MADLSHYEGMSWQEFMAWFGKKWKQGEHMALVAPTGEGKTTTITQLFSLRKWVMAIDAKGGDTTLSQLLHHGYVRITTWPPPRDIQEDIEDGRPTKLLVGLNRPTTSQLPRHKAVIQGALTEAFDAGGWTVAIDELQMTTDRRMLNLGAMVERHLILARDRKSSLVTAYQRPAWVPKSAAQMSTWFMVYYTRDLDAISDLAHEAGRSPAELRGAIRALGDIPHAALIFARNPRIPVIVTRTELHT